MMVKAMTDPETILERLEMADRAQFTPLEVMGGREKAQMEDMLRTLFLGTTCACTCTCIWMLRGLSSSVMTHDDW